MIIRVSERGLTLIRQTEHARLCGVMARAWGNDRFHPPEPRTPMLRAAAEHDNGWEEWEDAPRLNPETRRPYSYIDIPVDQHLEIYRRGIAHAVGLDPYVGVIVSLHGSLLYSRFRAGQPGAAQFLAQQERLRSRLIQKLAKDPSRGPYARRAVLAVNRDMLFGWDVLSLLISHGAAWQNTIVCPTDYDGNKARVKVGGGGERWWLDPFPFREPLELSISVSEIDAKTFTDQNELREALGGAHRRELIAVIEPE